MSYSLEGAGIRLHTEQTESGCGAHVIVSVCTADGREFEVIRSFTSGDHPDTIIDHFVTPTGIESCSQKAAQ